MATTVIHTVIPSGGDYTTLAAWEAAQQGDLVALDEIHEAEVHAFTDTTGVTIDGSVTDATRYMRVRPAPGAESQMPWGASGYQLAVDGNGLTALDDFTRLERFQIAVTSTSTARTALRLGASGVRAIGMHVQNTGTVANIGVVLQAPAATTVYAINCVSINAGGASATNGFEVNGGGASAVARIYNCTAIGWSNNFNKVLRDGIAKNCLGHGGLTNDFTGTWQSGTEYNASEDATAPGTNSRTSQTFTFVDAGSGDYHLDEADAAAKDFGIDLSADADFPFDTDFDDEDRPVVWDIGADEWVPIGPIEPETIGRVNRSSVPPNIRIG